MNGTKEIEAKESAMVENGSLPDKVRQKRERGTWSNQAEFMLSCIGFSVGLGNIWRFPYLALEQGGGAFLIPYTVFLFLVGMPLFFMELALGQSSGLSSSKVFGIIPIFKGIGYCQMAVSFVMCIYYNVIMAWIIYYFGMSFQWILPWSTCDNWWNKPDCFYFAQNNTQFNGTVNISTSAEQFWLYNVLEISDSINNPGGINWNLLICALVAWVLTFLCLSRGIRSTGKVVYVTALAPYLFLTIILIRGATLPGALEGIKYYIIPKWEKLAAYEIWVQAAMQVFYSLGPAWGGLITMASYNSYNHSIMRDAFLLPTICQLTSIFGGFAIFSVIGHLKHKAGVERIEDLIRQGPGLAFIAYPEALALTPGGPIWSVLFFLMLLTIGLDTQLVTLEVVMSGLLDLFPRQLEKRKLLVLLGVLFCDALLGLCLISRGGFYLFRIIDHYAAAFSVICIGLMEYIAISYVYGVRRLFVDIEDMIGPMKRITKVFWASLWLAIAPIFIIVLLGITLVTFGPPDDQFYPDWAIALGWIVALVSVIEFPIAAIYIFVKNRKNWRSLFQPSEDYLAHVAARRLLFEESKLIEVEDFDSQDIIQP